jgi:glycerol-3-phosphate acyltransferase PlsY
MQQIGKGAARAFKSLAGLDKEAPLTSFTIALYLFLFLVAMSLLALWAMGWPAA